jgi:hypothetical protein
MLAGKIAVYASIDGTVRALVSSVAALSSAELIVGWQY